MRPAPRPGAWPYSLVTWCRAGNVAQRSLTYKGPVNGAPDRRARESGGTRGGTGAPVPTGSVRHRSIGGSSSGARWPWGPAPWPPAAARVTDHGQGRHHTPGRLGPRCRRARRLPHAGEPLLRPLLRLLQGGPGLRRPSHGPPRRVRPALPGQHHRVIRPGCSSPSISTRPPGSASAPTTSTTAGCPQHLCRNDGAMDAFVKTHTSAAVRGSGVRRADHGVPHPGRPPLPLRTGRRLHPLRRLPLLDHGPHPPQPADGACRAPSIPTAATAARC